MEAAHPVPLDLDESSLSVPRLQASPWLVLLVLALGEFMILLDTTIVGVAVPSLATDLKATLDSVLWILNAYTLVFAVLLITAGRLGDMWGPKKMFLAGLAIFTLSSLACGLSQSPEQLIAFRICQAVGGATLMPQTLSIVTSIFPPEKRGAAFGAWSAVAGLAAVAGPTLGGLLVSTFSWRAVFFPNVPIGAAAILLAFLMMPEMTIHRRRRLDFVGVALATAALVALIFSVIEGQKYSWGRVEKWLPINIGPIHAGLVSIPSIFLLSVILLVLFVLWEARQPEPLLPLSLFRDRNYSLGNLVATCVNFVILGFFFPLTLFLQSALGFTAVHAGLTVVPNAIAIVIFAPVSGRLSDKLNPKFILMVGLFLFATGLYLVTRVASLSATSFTFAIPLAITGVGMGLTMAPMTSVAMRDIVPTAAGAASGFLNTIRQVGAAIGSAVTGAVLAHALATEMASQGKHYATQLPSQYRSGFLKAISNFSSGGLEVGAGKTTLALPKSVPASTAHQIQALGQTVYIHAFLNALRPTIYVCIPLLLLGVVISIFLRTRRAPKTDVVPTIPAAEPATAPAPIPIAAPLNVAGTVLTPIAVPHRVAVHGTSPIHAPQLKRIGSDTQYEIGGRSVTIGRLGSNDIQLDSPNVSRQHAQISTRAGRVMLRDLGTVNGTYVNGERVDREQELHDGDVVAVGDDAFTFSHDTERARPRLIGMAGSQTEHDITRPLTVGRASSNDIMLADPRASRYHAEVFLDRGNVVVRDLETLNGTFVNGQPVIGDWPLSPGDVVVFASTPFVYRNDFGE